MLFNFTLYRAGTDTLLSTPSTFEPYFYMSATSSNPWLTWLYGNDVAPVGVSAEVTLAAVVTIERACVKALRTFLGQSPQLETYRAWQIASDHVTVFNSWAETIAPYGSKRDARALKGPLQKSWRRHNRRWNRLCQPKSSYQIHLGKLERKLVRAQENHWVHTIRAEQVMNAEGFNETLAKHLTDLQKNIGRRQERLSAKLNQSGGLHLITWPAPAHAAAQAEARALAHDRNLVGYVVLPNSDPDRFLLAHSYDAQVRKQLWEQRQQVALRPADIERMRELRQCEAEGYGASDFASMAFTDTLFSTPARAERWLGAALDGLRGPLHRAIKMGASQLHLDEEGAMPWNFKHALHAIVGNPRLPCAPQTFPWRSCVLKVIPELLALGGWSCLSSPAMLGRGQSRLLRFRLRHKDGRRAQLFYSPFNPAPKQGDQTGAWCFSARQSLNDQPDVERVIMIAHLLPEKAEQQGLDLIELGYLCHELGHALHYLGLPGHTVGEELNIPMDLVELPAILLENYYRQPETLIRWMGAKAPKAARRPAYWARRLRFGADDTITFHRSIYRPYVDLRLSRKHTGPLDQVLAEADTRGGFLRHCQQREELDFFDIDEGAVGFSHIAGQALAMRLLPIHEHGQINSADIGARFSALLEDVLTRHTEKRSLHRAWRKFSGEGFIDSMKAGIAAVTRRECRVVKPKRKR